MKNNKEKVQKNTMFLTLSQELVEFLRGKLAATIRVEEFDPLSSKILDHCLETPESFQRLVLGLQKIDPCIAHVVTRESADVTASSKGGGF